MKNSLLPGLFVLPAIFGLCACDNSAQRAAEKRATQQAAAAENATKQMQLQAKLDGLIAKIETMTPGAALDAAKAEVGQIIADMAKLSPSPR